MKYTQDMEKPVRITRITVQQIMKRYKISQRTAIRWRKVLLQVGVLASASPCARTVVGSWSRIDRAVASGTVGRSF